MTDTAIPIKEFDAEMAATRRLIERMPTDKAEWKPHEKSFALGHLTQLVAGIPGWIARTLREPHIDLAAGPRYSFEKTDKLVALFDKNAQDAHAALMSVTGAALEQPWSLTMGPQVIMTLPRGEAARQHLNHLIHHRGQLTVYARLVDVPVPMMYGPTADEKWGG